MNEFLRFDGVNDVVTLASTVSVNAGTGLYTIEFGHIFTRFSTSNDYVLGANGPTANGICLRQASGNGALAIVAGGTFRYASAAGLVILDEYHVYRLEHDANGAVRWYRDGVPFGGPYANFTASVTMTMGQFARGTNASAVYTPMDLGYLTLTGFSNSQSWNAALSNGSGSILPTVSGANQGTLVNFATDGSQWIGFGAAAAEFASALLNESSFVLDLQVGSLFATELFSESSLTADLPVAAINFAAALQGESGLTSALTVPVLLAAGLTGESSIVVGFATSGATLAGTLGCEAVLTAGLVLPINLQSTLLGESALTSNLLAPRFLATALLGESSLTCSFSTSIVFGANLLGESAVTSALAAPAGLGVTLLGESTVVVNLAIPERFQSLLLSESSLVAGLETGVTFSSVFTSESAISVVLEVPVYLGALITSTSDLLADLVAGAGVGEWGDATFVFNEPLPIREIALTFDQQGRPLIFYRVDNDTLKMYWYDASVSQNVLLNLGQGVNPRACFDYINQVNYQQSDALIAYVRGNSVYWRVFRESFAVERLVRTFPTAVFLESFGLIEGNRIQLAVRTNGVCSIELMDILTDDVVSVQTSVYSLTLVETFVPVDPDPKPPVDTPDPEVPPEPPVVKPPEGRQGYWVQKTTSGGWVHEGAWFNEVPGFRTSIKLKKTYKPYATNFYICSGGYAIKSPTNQYYSLTFAVYEDFGEVYVEYRGNVQKAPRFWTSDIVPLHKIEVEIRKDLSGRVLYYKELADGSGYEAPIVYAFPLPFTDPNNPPFETWAYEKTGFGGLPQHFQSINVQSNTVFADFVVETENAFGQFVPRFHAPLTQWNVAYQSGFYIAPYLPQYWVRITEA